LNMYWVFQYYLWGFARKHMEWSETAQWKKQHFNAVFTTTVLRFCKLSSQISRAIFKVRILFKENKQQAGLPQSQ